jgi:MFS family permease
VGDRFGHRINLLIASIVIFINSILAISVHTVAVVYVIFILDALVMSMVQISRFSIIAEFCGTKERPTYIALANMVTSPFILLGLAGGLLADSFGYDVVFLIAGSGGLFASFWWIFRIREPRQYVGTVQKMINH